MAEQAANVIVLSLFTKFQPFGLDEGIVPDGCGSLSELAAEFLLFGLVHAAGSGGGIGLDERHDCHRGGSVGGNGELNEKALVKGLAVVVDGLVHEQSALAIDDMSPLILLIAAQHVRVLDDDGVGAHLDHETAGVLDAGAWDEELIAAMKQDDEIIEAVPVAPDISRSEEHTSELQSLRHLVCRLL